eukprot:11154045-Lingulodinium_polyedra.AAC.1
MQERLEHRLGARSSRGDENLGFAGVGIHFEATLHKVGDQHRGNLPRHLGDGLRGRANWSSGH